MSHVLDKELEKRGHWYCRYTYDFNVFFKKKKSGDRVMANIGKFIEEKLKVNQSKNAVDSPKKQKFLGLSFYQTNEGIKVKIHLKSLERIKAKVKFYTKRSNVWSGKERLSNLSGRISVWVNYFKITDM